MIGKEQPNVQDLKTQPNIDMLSSLTYLDWQLNTKTMKIPWDSRLIF